MGDGEHEGRPVCFLCLEERAEESVVRACRCDVHVHHSCFVKLLSVPAHATRCPVCCHTYRLRLSRASWTPDWHRILGLAMFCVSVVFLVGVCVVARAGDLFFRALYLLLLVVLTSLTLSCGTLLARHLAPRDGIPERRRACCLFVPGAVIGVEPPAECVQRV